MLKKLLTWLVKLSHGFDEIGYEVGYEAGYSESYDAAYQKHKAAFEEADAENNALLEENKRIVSETKHECNRILEEVKRQLNIIMRLHGATADEIRVIWEEGQKNETKRQQLVALDKLMRD